MKGRLQVRLRIDFPDGSAVGPGKIALLEAIARTGSLSAAARSLGMSYRRGWLLVRSLNQGFRVAVVESSVGGADGGGARITPLGADLVARYRAFEAEVELLAGHRFKNPAPQRSADVRSKTVDGAGVRSIRRPLSATRPSRRRVRSADRTSTRAPRDA